MTERSLIVASGGESPLADVYASGRVWGLAEDPSAGVVARPPSVQAVIVRSLYARSVVSQASALAVLERSELSVSPDLLLPPSMVGVDWTRRMAFEQGPLLRFYDARILQDINTVRPGPSCIAADFCTETAHHAFLVLTPTQYPLEAPRVRVISDTLAPGCPRAVGDRPDVFGPLPWTPAFSLALVVALTAHWLTSHDDWRRTGTWKSHLF